MKRFPEFVGYRPVRFPGTEPPRKPRISPRRLNLPPSFASDWKKIKSKRTKMMTLDMPLWEGQKRKKYNIPSIVVDHSTSIVVDQIQIQMPPVVIS